MELSGLIAQRAIVLPVLADAQATLSAASSMGQLLTFESTVAPVAEELVGALRARRVTRALQRALPILSGACDLVAAEELSDAIDHAREVLRSETAATDGTAMAQAVLVLNALGRARLAVAVILDICEGLRIAPNGKPLMMPRATTSPPPEGIVLFDDAL